MELAWTSPLAGFDVPATESDTAWYGILLTSALYAASLQTRPELAAQRVNPPVQVYSGAEAESVNLRFADIDAAKAVFPNHWYNPDDV